MMLKDKKTPQYKFENFIFKYYISFCLLFCFFLYS